MLYKNLDNANLYWETHVLLSAINIRIGSFKVTKNPSDDKEVLVRSGTRKSLENLRAYVRPTRYIVKDETRDDKFWYEVPVKTKDFQKAVNDLIGEINYFDLKDALGPSVRSCLYDEVGVTLFDMERKVSDDDH
jgi:hypothetical protein